MAATAMPSTRSRSRPGCRPLWLAALALAPSLASHAAFAGRRTAALTEAPATMLASKGAALGRLDVRVADADSGAPLSARVYARPLGGQGRRGRTRAAPATIEDSDTGASATSLAPGRYLVVVTHGPEFSADAREVEVRRGAATEMRASLRRVAPTPGWSGCDLHVHTRGFDSPASVDDRVRSLAAAGLDFAVPSEHNHVGSLEAATTPGATSLASAPGVEVTTSRPQRGHFNVFPYDAAVAPRAFGTSAAGVVRDVRRLSPGSLVQVNHPRLGRGEGLFGLLGPDPSAADRQAALPDGVDLFEVYNGFDLARPSSVDVVLADWLALVEAGRNLFATGGSDSHAVHDAKAGYPRTYVRTGDPDDHRPAVDAVVSGLRAGHAFVTSGPLLEVDAGGAGPGDEAEAHGETLRVHVRVSAAPWVDVSRLEVMVGGRAVVSRSIAPRPLFAGPPSGSPEEARAAALRFDETLEVPLRPANARSLVVVVRGDRRLSETVPGLKVTPLAFSNPIFLRR